MTSLADLAISQRGYIVRVDGADDLTMRLLEMGLTPGVEVTLIGVAPLGDPIEVQLRGFRLSLRKREASRVAIELT